MLKGLPGSGKSTVAKQIISTNPKYKRINKDELRDMLDNGQWTKANEKFIVYIRDSIISLALHNGYSVVVDDTNLAPKHALRLKELAKINEVEFEERFIDTPIEECIKRDLLRSRSVGEKVIKKMQKQFLGEPRFIEKVKYDDNLHDAIIVDIDGTLAIRRDRSPYDWSKVGQDDVNETIRKLLIRYRSIQHLILVSGRDSCCRAETVDWLKRNNIAYDELFMRPEGNNEKDSIIKKRIYEDHIKGRFNVDFVLDDRNQVVEMWRELGLTCLQVAEGDF